MPHPMRFKLGAVWVQIQVELMEFFDAGFKLVNAHDRAVAQTHYIQTEPHEG